MTAKRNAIALVILVVLALATLRDTLRLGDAVPWRQMIDFQDFYCAGAALDEGRNPYTYEPQRSCEHRVNTSDLFTQHPALVIPAPQPPYDFPPFMLLAKFGFSRAREIYALAIILSAVLAALALARTGIPLDITAAALAMPVAYVELNAGQVVPFSFLFLTLAGAALATRRDALAGICAAMTTIEPHLGLPVALAALIFVPRARVALLLTAAALGAIGVATVGPAVALAYVLRVIPAHALTELSFPYQYSLTYALGFFGVPARIAEPVGDLSYVVCLVAGLWIGVRIARRLSRRDLLVFFPAATSVMAGPFLHMVDLCFAIPAALVLTTKLTGSLRNFTAAALCALMIPWIIVWAIKRVFLANIFFCAYLLVRTGIAPGVILAILSSLAVIIYSFEFRAPHVQIPLSRLGPFSAGDLAQRGWRAFTAGLTTHDIRWILIKLPTWTALATLLTVALAYLRGAGADQHESTQTKRRSGNDTTLAVE